MPFTGPPDLQSLLPTPSERTVVKASDVEMLHFSGQGRPSTNPGGLKKRSQGSQRARKGRGREFSRENPFPDIMSCSPIVQHLCFGI